MFNGTPQSRSLVDVSVAIDQNNVANPAIQSPFQAGRAASGVTYHNKSASGTVTVLLPSDAQNGDHFYAMEVSAHNIVFDPTALNGQATGTNATGAITDGASTTTATTGLYTSSSVGAYVELVCIAAGPVWQVVNKLGTWTVS